MDNKENCGEINVEKMIVGSCCSIMDWLFNSARRASSLSIVLQELLYHHISKIVGNWSGGTCPVLTFATWYLSMNCFLFFFLQAMKKGVIEPTMKSTAQFGSLFLFCTFLFPLNFYCKLVLQYPSNHYWSL